MNILAPDQAIEWIALVAAVLVPPVAAFAARTRNTRPAVAAVLSVALAVLTVLANDEPFQLTDVATVAVEAMVAQLAAFKIIWSAPAVDVNARADARRGTATTERAFQG